MVSYFVNIIFRRSYKYLLLTFSSLLVGAFLFGAILSLATSLSSFFTSQGKVLIGGDIVINGPYVIDTNSPYFINLKSMGHTLISESDLQVVFRNTSGSSTLAASVRAIDDGFPLYGQINLENNVPLILSGNKLYAEQLFLERLGIVVGDNVYIGDTSFTVTGVITSLPDAVSLGVSFSPRVLIAKDNLLTSGIDFGQSRVSYKLLIKENESQPFTNETIASIKAYAKENKLRFDDARDGPNNLVRGLSSVEDFGGIVLAIALFLVAVNIGANLTYILARFKKTIALLKTYGATTNQIWAIYSIILGSIGVTAGFIGSFLGIQIANSLLPALSTYVEGIIPESSSFTISFLGALTGGVLIIISAIPFFNSLKSISPKELLASTSTPNSTSGMLVFLTYLPIPLVLAVLLFTISKNILLTAYSVLGLITLFVFYMAISYGIISLLYKNRTRYSFIFSSIISFLKWRGLETIITSASIMTALSGVFIVSAIEHNIIYNVQGTISKSAPSMYLVDITTSQLSKVKELAGSTFTEYPIIRGRLLHVNERDMTTSTDRGVTREFNMTYRNNLIDGETIVSGVWHGTSATTKSVSIENSFAEQIGGVNLGDTITVFIQGLEVRATVTSIHEADKSRGTPYFYLVFSPDVLSTFPSSYFGTVEGSKEEVSAIRNSIGSIFPNIIPIETGTILEIVNSLLGTIILVVQVIGIPSIILGLMLVLVMTGQSLYERKGDVLILRVFGLKKKMITFLFVAEAGILILVATGISYVLAHLIAYILNIYLFSFNLFSFASIPLYISFSILIITVIFSYYVASTIVKVPLKELLAEK